MLCSLFRINREAYFLRRNHRTLAIIMCVLLALTSLTGILYTILNMWFGSQADFTYALLEIHTGRIVNLEAIYPILNGIGLLGLLVSGVILLQRRKVEERLDDSPNQQVKPR